MKLFSSKKNSLFYIAEIGSAHEGSFPNAIKLITEACKSNADCVKIQIYKAEKLVAKKYDLKRFLHFKKMELKIWQYIILAKICKKFKKLFCASIWDKDLIFKFKNYVDIFKVGSGDLTNYEIIEKITETNKPLIISVGLSNFNEIKKTLDFIKTKNKKYLKAKVALLHCNTAYPTPLNDVNLKQMLLLKKKFKLTTGYSDHTIGDSAIIYAKAMGAEIIEKHFSNDISKTTFRDHQISLNKTGVNAFLEKINLLFNFKKSKLTASEINQNNEKSFRRSIYAHKNIKIGEKFTKNNLISLRPFIGVSADNIISLYKKKSKKNYTKGDLIDAK
jgi:N,N'-diacetyllegionaminate synthase